MYGAINFTDPVNENVEQIILGTKIGLIKPALSSDGVLESVNGPLLKDCKVTGLCQIRDSLLLCTLLDSDGVAKIKTFDLASD